MCRWVAVIPLVLTFQSLLAQDTPASAEVERWLNAELTKPLFSNLATSKRYFVTSDTQSTRSSSYLDALRLEVANKPEHPRRFELLTTEALKSHGSRRDVQVWFRSLNLWRISSEESGGMVPDGHASDAGGNKSDVWRVAAGSMSIIGQRDERKPEHRGWDPASSLVAEVITLDLCLSGFDMLRSKSGQLQSVVWKNGVNEAKISSNVGQWELMVQKSPQSGKLRIQEISFSVPERPGYAGHWVRKNFQTFDSIDDVATEVEYSSDIAGLKTVYRLQTIESISENDLIELARTPIPDANDPVRGSWNIKGVKDLRRGATPLLDTPVGSGQGMSGSWMKQRNWMSMIAWASWAVAGVGIAIIIAIKMRRAL